MAASTSQSFAYFDFAEMESRHSELPRQPRRKARLPTSVRAVDNNDQQRQTLGRQRPLDTFEEFI